MLVLLPEIMATLQDASPDVKMKALLVIRNIMGHVKRKEASSMAVQHAEELLPLFIDVSEAAAEAEPLDGHSAVPPPLAQLCGQHSHLALSPPRSCWGFFWAGGQLWALGEPCAQHLLPALGFRPSMPPPLPVQGQAGPGPHAWCRKVEACRRCVPWRRCGGGTASSC